MANLDHNIPSIGLGTWKQSNLEQCEMTVSMALNLGYRHLDTAQDYGNETAVGAGICRSSVPREDVYLATKVHRENLGYTDLLESTDRSLGRLDVEMIDLLYVHWPSDTYDPAETFDALEELYDRGAIRGIGLSNFTQKLITEAIEHCDAPIQAVQVEMHPFLQQESLRAYLREHDIPLVAYCPLAHGRVLESPKLESIANDNDTSPAVVSLAWLLSKPNVYPIPKATSETHLRENLTAVDAPISAQDLRKIDDLNRQERILDPDHVPEWSDRSA